MRLKSTDYTANATELLTLLDETTDATIVSLAKTYDKLPANERSDWLDQFKESPETLATFDLLTHYWANRVQLTTKAAIITSENQLVEAQDTSQALLTNSDEAPYAIAMSDAALVVEDPSIKEATELTALRERLLKERLNSATAVPVVLGSVHDAIRNAKLNNLPPEQVAEIIHSISIELIHTAHPTNPLAEHASDALKAITPGIHEDDLRQHIGTLVSQDLVPHKKRTVAAEAASDMESLEANYDHFPTLRHTIHQAVHTYYPEAYNSLKDTIDLGLGICSPAMAADDKQASKGIVPSGSWAASDADGNDNVKADDMLAMIQQRRLAAVNKHHTYIQKHILPNIPAEQESLNSAFEDFSRKLLTYHAAISSDAYDKSLTKDMLQEQFAALWHDHAEAITAIPELNNAVRNFSGQLQNFGLNLGRSDIRQKSFKNTAALNAILEDLKQDVALQRSPVLKMLEGTTYASLPEPEKLTFQRKLLDGSEESKQIFACIRVLHATEHYKQPKFKPEVQEELDRMQVASQHTDFIQKMIISNTEETSDLFTCDIMQEIFGASRTIATMPLMEDITHLDQAQTLLEPHIQFHIQRALEIAWDKGEAEALQALGIAGRDTIADNVRDKDAFRALHHAHPELKRYYADYVLNVMAGPSDSSREGSTAALISISHIPSVLQTLADDYGIGFSFFYGAGADIGRGSESQSAEQQTGQGNFKHNIIPDTFMQQQKTERQFEGAFQQRVKAGRATSPETREALTQYKKGSQENYETLYRTKKQFTESLTGYGDLMAVLYGIDTHHLVTVPNNYSSRASVLGHADAPHPCAKWQNDWSAESGRPSLYVSVENLRAITKTWDDEIARHYTNIVYGPGFGLRSVAPHQATAMFENDATFRDIMDKTAIGLALTDFSLAWENFPAELRPYKKDGTLDKEQLHHRAEIFRSGATATLLDMDIPAMLAKGPHSTEFKTVIEMVADMHCMLHEEYLITQKHVTKLLHTVYFEEGKAFTPANKPTDILFYRPELQAHYERILPALEPLSRLNATMNREIIVEGKGINTVFPGGINHDKHLVGELDPFRKITGHIAAGTEAARADVPQHYDRNYLDLRQPILTGKECAQALRKEATGAEGFAQKLTAERLARMEGMTGRQVVGL